MDLPHKSACPPESSGCFYDKPRHLKACQPTHSTLKSNRRKSGCSAGLHPSAYHNAARGLKSAPALFPANSANGRVVARLPEVWITISRSPGTPNLCSWRKTEIGAAPALVLVPLMNTMPSLNRNASFFAHTAH